MRNNRTLAVAIAATLATTFYAGTSSAGTFANGSCLDTDTSTGKVTFEKCATTIPFKTDGNDGAPQAQFDFNTGGDRVHVPSGGTVYATELFGAGSDTLILPDNDADISNDSAYHASVVYTIQGNIDVDFEMAFTLDNGAKFSRSPFPTLSTDANAGTAIEHADKSANSASTLEAIAADFTNSDSTVTFRVLAGAQPIVVNEKIALMYNFTSASALAQQGEEIKMAVRVSLPFPDANTLVETSEEVVIATSKPCIECSIAPETEGRVRISVASEETKFDGEGNAYVPPDSARIGYLAIMNVPGVYNRTAINECMLGETTAAHPDEAAGIDADDNVYSKLVINNGQFEASKTNPDGTTGSGGVYLDLSSDIYATTVDATTATWNFTDAQLKQITDGSINNQVIPIVVKPDGTNKINVNTDTDDPPSAELTIDFQNDTNTDISKDSVNLLKIIRDGVVCSVYNVPSPGANDILNLRINNESTISGALMGTMYNQDGSVAWNNVSLLGADADGNPIELAPHNVIRLTSQMLEDAGGAWSGRGVLTITTQLPRMEMLSLLRQTTGAAAGHPRPLTNLSLGATGSSCTD